MNPIVWRAVAFGAIAGVVFFAIPAVYYAAHGDLWRAAGQGAAAVAMAAIYRIAS